MSPAQVRAAAARARRKAWLKARRLVGLLAPLPLSWFHINLMGASAGEDQSRRVLRNAVRQGYPLITGVEAFRLDVAAELRDLDPKHEWHVAQDCSSEDRAGSFLAVRADVGHIRRWKLKLGCLPFHNGKRADRLRTRWFIHATVVIDPGTKHRWTFRGLRVGHVPPGRNAFLVPVFLARFAAGGTAHAADWNLTPAAVRRWNAPRGRRVRMVEVMGFAIARWIPTTQVAEAVDIKGDHPGAVTTMWPPRSENP